MKGFKNTTRMVEGHHHVPGHEFHTFGKSNPGHRLAHGGPVTAHDPIHGEHNPAGQLTERDPSGNFSGHAAVHRRVPSTEELAEHGGKTPLLSGYAEGGRAEKHFHVHKHYHTGGKVKSTHKSYGGSAKLAGRAGDMQGSKRFTAARTAGGFGTHGKPGPTRHKLKTGGTINKMKKGGMHINPAHKGKFTKKMTGSKHGHLTGSDVQRGLHSKSAETRKEANFARMARRHFKPLAKGGHVHDCTDVIAPNYATGGTINRLGAGGALYAEGGHVPEPRGPEMPQDKRLRAAAPSFRSAAILNRPIPLARGGKVHESSHEKSREHSGFRSELSNLRRKVGA